MLVGRNGLTIGSVDCQRRGTGLLKAGSGRHLSEEQEIHKGKFIELRNSSLYFSVCAIRDLHALRHGWKFAYFCMCQSSFAISKNLLFTITKRLDDNTRIPDACHSVVKMLSLSSSIAHLNDVLSTAKKTTMKTDINETAHRPPSSLTQNCI